MRRVVITGMSPACSLGSDHEELFSNLCDKKQVLKKIEKDTPCKSKIRASYCVPFPDLEVNNKFADKLRQVKTKGSKSSYAAAKCALMAADDAGLEKVDDNTTVFVGSDTCSMEELTDQITGFDREQKMNIMMIPVTNQSSIAGWVTIALGAHGMSSIVNMACASSTAAIGLGYESILYGKTDMSVCGGSSLVADKNLTLVKGLEYLKCASTDKEGHVYPFSEERNGFLFCEGAACMVVLEELEHAKARNARIYAEITGFESSSDAYGIVSMNPDGHIIEDMLRKLIGDKKVDYYNAHGTATALNDKVEADVLRRIFGDKENQPAINTTKAILGHSLAASGALETLVCVDSIRHSKIHGNICGTLFENLNITPETREMEVNCAVSASFGFGGHNAALMFEKYEG